MCCWDVPAPGGYDTARGAQVIAHARTFLDRAVPLAGVHWAAADGFVIVDGQLSPPLQDLSALVGYTGDPT